ncbi:MAG: HDIG domain-containing protein [Candidatus Aureabacteria bacterium]|nr:HDIG domain-containing protein [Candidatus Auribacterota bacterium]
MAFNWLKKFREKKKIPKKRSQAEDKGLLKLFNESYWIKFAVVSLSTLFLSFFLSGVIYGPSVGKELSSDVFILFLVLLAIQGILQIYLWLFEKDIFANNKKQLLLSVIILLTVFLQSVILHVPFFTKHAFTQFIFMAPFGLMLMTLFFPIRMSFIFAFVFGVYMGLMKRMIPEAVFIVPVISAFSSIFMKEVRNRYQITKAGIYTSAVTLMLILIVHSMTGNFNLNDLKDYTFGALVTGLVSILLILTLPYILELIFREVTNVSLLELSDLNHKLLKELVMIAPGTYHHSITVANIAEAAAEAIGARSLLVRVMGYYHDIGKLIKTEYFSENEAGGKSMHLKLSASMSSLIIISHVKNGVDIARRYKLPRAIIDGIKEHHGTSLVYYFYKRAQDEVGEKEVVKEENFRYPGPKPQSKETAILSVADTIEAASRSLAEPSPSRIKGLVGELLKDKYISGELDECNLTFRELKIIKEVVIRLLTARFHTRPVYPEKTNA